VTRIEPKPPDPQVPFGNLVPLIETLVVDDNGLEGGGFSLDPDE
jgi:hypothetical protein